MLAIDSLVAGYRALPVLRGVSLTVGEAEVVTLVGPNGAGKTSLLRSICGSTDVSAGYITFAGASLLKADARTIVRSGIAHAPQGRHLFGDLTVMENLRLGVYAVPKAQRAECFEHQFALVSTMFPAISTFLDRLAKNLSGGQQQMVTLARALMSRPRLLLLDEPSTGLAPAPLHAILEAVVELRQTGVSTLLVEQVASVSLRIADRAYVIRSGEIVDSATGAELLSDHDRLVTGYFGTGGRGQALGSPNETVRRGSNDADPADRRHDPGV